jgi:hypothetical protein
MSNNIPIIINFNDNFGKYIHPVILLVPRTSIFLSVYSFIHNNILQNLDDFCDNNNIKLVSDNNIDILWFLPVGVLYDIIYLDHLNLICNKITKGGLFDTPIYNTKLMVQQRLKHGLGTIFNSAKAFMDLNVQEVEKYISFSLSVNNEDDLEENFYNILNKIYSKKSILVRIPLAFHTKNKIEFYAPEMTEKKTEEETLKDIVWKSGINIQILENSQNIVINGILLEGWKDVPISWAIKNMCSSDLFIHVVLKH